MIPVAEVILGEAEKRYVNECLDTTWISSLGRFVTQFEEGFAAFCGSQYGIATFNGTTALHLALAVLGIGEGDEVIVPSLTFVATANAVYYARATPVFVDSERQYWQMDPAAVEAVITPRTRAIIPVHLYGHPVDMDPILDLAERRGLWVIEDAAEAHGARYKGRRVGSLGHFGSFSFYGNKIITTGEGGMLTTDDADYAARAAWLRDHGMDKERRYWHPEIGFNYRMTNIQAALGCGQLERIEQVLLAKRQLAAWYNERLGEIPGLSLPAEAPWAENVYWMYSIVVEDAFGPNRDELAAELRAAGIDSRPFFYPIHVMPPYRTGQHLPVAEDLAVRGLNLPSSPALSEDQVDYICQTISRLRLAPRRR
ncbi:MAG: DegT/DnrJ/EryC1/StrS family aminotransferase [Ardenticatenaceae bacterium]|nr:DegT/DnrJ/EryC1/StrS family aminotransferase [Ardenticatenaceae bacterium]HBY92829.1 aminotransferase DegT [Chloroflexota bacterium]